MVALIGAGCSNASSENGSSGGNKNATNREKAVKFAECMREKPATAPRISPNPSVQKARRRLARLSRSSIVPPGDRRWWRVSALR
jgi:hypothetical protein